MGTKDERTIEKAGIADDDGEILTDEDETIILDGLEQ